MCACRNFPGAKPIAAKLFSKKGRVRLVMGKDGGLSGLVGGYRDWREVYARDTFNVPSGGATRETYYHQNQIAMYYALKRNADAMPDPKTGRNTAISTAFRFTAKPAFVVDPPVPLAVDQPPYPGGDKAMTERKRFLRPLPPAPLRLRWFASVNPKSRNKSPTDSRPSRRLKPRIISRPRGVRSFSARMRWFSESPI